MKHITEQSGLVLLAFAVIGITAYLMPLMLDLFQNVSYRFVIMFLVLVLASNILAKIARRFLNA